MSYGYWFCEKCKDYRKLHDPVIGNLFAECGHSIDSLNMDNGFPLDDQYYKYILEGNLDKMIKEIKKKDA